jgi:integrase
MPRKTSGSVIPPKSKGRSWAIRFTAYGQRHHVTLDPDRDWDQGSAEEELANVLADVRRDIWKPEPARRASAPSDAPTFQVFASEWLAPQEGRVSKGTFRQYRRTLTAHLLPHFGAMHLDEIKVQDVDRYRDAMVAKSEKRQEAIDDGDPIKSKSGQLLRPLSAYSINKSISQLSTIMELAVEYGHAPSNPASGKRRRLKAKKPRQHFVKPEQLPALLEAADELTWPTVDKDGKPVEVDSKYQRTARLLLATIAYAGGLRISEALALTWGDINLGSRTLYVRESKTDAGVREVEIPVEVAELLAELKAEAEADERAEGKGRKKPKGG